MQFHALKDALIDELHTRPFPVITLPAQVSSIAVLNPAPVATEIQRLATLASAWDMPAPEQGASCFYQSCKNFDIRWERHNEFSTYTVISSGPSTGAAQGALALLGSDWLSSISGEIISATISSYYHLMLRLPDVRLCVSTSTVSVLSAARFMTATLQSGPPCAVTVMVLLKLS